MNEYHRTIQYKFLSSPITTFHCRCRCLFVVAVFVDEGDLVFFFINSKIFLCDIFAFLFYLATVLIKIIFERLPFFVGQFGLLVRINSTQDNLFQPKMNFSNQLLFLLFTLLGVVKRITFISPTPAQFLTLPYSHHHHLNNPKWVLGHLPYSAKILLFLDVCYF